ncbi:uncharacterized protein GLRG_07846 [Colletotrichum graminicola M1.001]|uniref:Uncharacterized protein n=1 Tax=Colletotrichum graminicola (strain M1.001 / M2 / FGSC 10212) TaxID=645133 RepID=E3QPB4_COLGM|nr:uncharacterized protein GLRG_07846 [Colletotrichum graminicola M1.001]EFQ32702.1 hypothetical protein GLRG_07846 [Colletotrichum graminicola M1.001]
MPFPVLSKEPFPQLSLSAAGLVALADLQTIANRTALTGTSSWFDALVLAPGLHYQQAADGVAGSAVTAETSSGTPGIFGTQALPGGRRIDVRVTNPGMLLFLSRLGVRDTELLRIITLDVGTLGSRGRRRGRAFAHDADWEFERASHLLYLTTPALTFAALTIMVLLADWWGLSLILALIASRVLNIYVIKQRTPPPPPPPPPTTVSSSSAAKLSEFIVPLSPTLKVRMRGPAADLAALTTDAWLLSKTAVQGYLEAAAKLVVYMVAVFSGNVSQAGNLVLLVLLLASAGLLGLSNGFVTGVRARGRVARVWNGDGHGPAASPGGPGVGNRQDEGNGAGAVDWDAQVGRIIRDPYPFERGVEYS